MGIYHRIKHSIQFILLVALFNTCFSVFAVTPDKLTRLEFSQGTQLFKKGQYSAAAKKFKKAEAQGMKSLALDYNLASSYYKLADYNKSRIYFNKIRSYPEMRYLAEYNLGLIAEKQRNKPLATKLFSSVNENSEDKKLVALAENKLTKLRPAAKTSKRKWSAYASLAYGYDDNVSFAPTGISSNLSDNFFELIAFADYVFSGDKNNGWLAEASYYGVDYSKENFDEYDYGIGVKKYQKLNADKNIEYSMNINKLNYAGSAYQSIIRLGVQIGKKLSTFERLYLRYGYEDIRSENTLYNYLEGSRHKFRTEYRQYNKSNIKKIYYELELNNRIDLTTASYSPRRHTVRGRYTHIFSKDWRLTGDLAYRISNYPTIASQDRNDTRLKASAYFDYYFDATMKLRAKVEYADNNSNINTYDYTRTVYTIGASKSF